jgi:hypothetical protein
MPYFPPIGSDIYLVLENFRSGAAWRETDETDTDFPTLINYLLSDQYEHPLRVVAFNPAEGWWRDAYREVPRSWSGGSPRAARRSPRRCWSSSRATPAGRSVCSWRCPSEASERMRAG